MVVFGRRISVIVSTAALLLAAGLAAGLALEPQKKPGGAQPASQPGQPTRVSKPPTAKPPPRVDPKPAPKTEPKSEPKSDPHGEPKHEPKPEATPAHPAPSETAPPKHEAKPEAAHEPDEAERLLTGTPTPTKRTAESDANPSTPEAALALLREGNTRWVKGRPQHPHVELEHRMEVGEKGQKPFAAILTCADSRLPVERLFDRGVGDLFVVRVAGNTAGGSEGGSIEYAVEHLHTPILVVMGHTKCGAVAAATASSSVAGPIGAVIEQIQPAVERARAGNSQAKEDEVIAVALRENVWQSVFTLLRGSKLLRDKCKANELRVVGAIYNVAEGTVDFMGPHPWQAELIAAFEARANRQGPAQADAEHPAGER